MVNNDSDRKYMDMVPYHVRGELLRLLESSLSIRERWEIAKAKAEAEAGARMVIADFLIDEGLMKRVLPRRKG